jgi:hypothetical protein
MFTSDTLADKAGALLFQRAERRLEALLAEHGASNSGDLPRTLQAQLLQRAILETGAANFPAVNFEMLKHGFGSFLHPAFIAAMKRMRISCKSPGDALNDQGRTCRCRPREVRPSCRPFRPRSDAHPRETEQRHRYDAELVLVRQRRLCRLQHLRGPFLPLADRLCPHSAAAGAGPPEAFRSKGAVCASTQALTARSPAMLRARNGHCRPPTGRYRFDCRAV